MVLGLEVLPNKTRQELTYCSQWLWIVEAVVSPVGWFGSGWGGGVDEELAGG